MFFNNNIYESQGSSVSNFMHKVYAWMSLGLAITASIAFYIFKNPATIGPVLHNPWLLFGLILVQFLLVIALSAFVIKMSFPAALIMFAFYSATVGLTLSFIFEIYTATSIYTTFLVTSGMFLLTSIYGYLTKSDLSSIGSFAMMALFGLILTGFINIFLHSSTLDYIYSIVGVIVFTLLTAYDTQQIKMLARKLIFVEEKKGNIAILGALTLYLDFINLFLFLLRFTGKQKD